VHALLRHYEAVGFDGAPRALGLDDDGREIVGYVEGDVPGTGPTPADDATLFEVGRLVRTMHDAQRDFVPPANAEWQTLPGAIPGSEVIAHNDALGTNVVFRDGKPVALIDWEFAAPGPRIADVAAAAGWWAPLGAHREPDRYGLPTDRRSERLRALADGYDLERRERGTLVASILRLLEGWHEAYRVLGGVERRDRWAPDWDAGRGEFFTTLRRWIAEHRTELERCLR
jgi:aminoglycoside phosphotransferase (APT) family kinase protein